jgi:hypothetical protein
MKKAADLPLSYKLAGYFLLAGIIVAAFVLSGTV